MDAILQTTPSNAFEWKYSNVEILKQIWFYEIIGGMLLMC